MTRTGGCCQLVNGVSVSVDAAVLKLILCFSFFILAMQYFIDSLLYLHSGPGVFGLTLTETGSGFDGDSTLQGKSMSRLTVLLLTPYLRQSDGESRRCRLCGLKVSSPLGALLQIKAGGMEKKKKKP